jgi:hypothetical protein
MVPHSRCISLSYSAEQTYHIAGDGKLSKLSFSTLHYTPKFITGLPVTVCSAQFWRAWTDAA